MNAAPLIVLELLESFAVAPLAACADPVYVFVIALKLVVVLLFTILHVKVLAAVTLSPLLH